MNNITQLITRCHCESDAEFIPAGHLAGCPYGDADYCLEYHQTRTHVATVVVPVRTVSELNRHEHWRLRQKRAKVQHEVVGWACVDNGFKIPFEGVPVHVHLTRLASRKLDTDNLAGSLKHVRDAVAKYMGCDDGDESKITWSVGQEPQKGYAVRIEFYWRSSKE